MPLKPLAILAALFSSLILLLAGYIYVKPKTGTSPPAAPIVAKPALPPVEIAPPVRDVTPSVTRDVTPSVTRDVTPSVTRDVTQTSPQVAIAAPPVITPPSSVLLPMPMPKGVELVRNDAILKPNVRKMREKLLEAAASGNINRLNIVFQTNETQPIFTRGKERDPVAFWKKASGDGQGREILSALANIMAMPAALVHKGTPQEMYVWPYLAHVSLKTLTPAQEVDLYKLLTAQDVKDMVAYGKWVHWRVGIGPDGTLHYFVAGE